MARLVIHGARGAFPACTPSCMRYGGHTTCYALETDEGVLVVDAGSGLVDLGRRLTDEDPTADITILFTHFHMDHVMGLPFFAPLYEAGRSVHFARGRDSAEALQARLENSVSEPFWPIQLSRVSARLHFEDLDHEGPYSLRGVRVSCCPVRHPQPCLAYRLETPRRSFAIVTDHEPGEAAVDERVATFCQGVDVLVCDAQYKAEEFPERAGWGHGTWQSAVQLAQDAGVSELVLTHHDPQRSDEQIDRIVEEAAAAFPSTRGAREGMALTA